MFVNRGSEGKILWFEDGPPPRQDEQIRGSQGGGPGKGGGPLSRSASIFPQSTGDCNQGVDLILCQVFTLGNRLQKPKFRCSNVFHR